MILHRWPWGKVVATTLDWRPWETVVVAVVVSVVVVMIIEYLSFFQTVVVVMILDYLSFFQFVVVVVVFDVFRRQST